ncbi:LCCL domain containing protein [Colletotrichum tofieldiae]|nr:LCCL domain containing protein [Colletotrichum tofieldiae]
MGAAGDGFPLRDRPFKDSEDDDADDKYAPRRGVDEEAQFLADEEYELEESTSSRPSLSQQKFPHTPSGTASRDRSRRGAAATA